MPSMQVKKYVHSNDVYIIIMYKGIEIWRIKLQMVVVW